MLPKKSKVHKVKHHDGAPVRRDWCFPGRLRGREGTAARALEFAILTASRTEEVTAATWDEIKGNVWTVPEGRMKGGREHRVPLTDAHRGARTDAKGRENAYVFPGERRATLSNMAMLMLLRRMGRGDITVHGFRSTFKDWASERTTFPNEVSEAALAHAVGDKVEAAYRRGDLFEKRRRLMEAWAEYCASAEAGAKVVSIRERENVD